MSKLSIKNGFFSESVKYPLLFLLVLLLICYVYTLFYPIPTPIHYGDIGIGADYLEIGDRPFYFFENSNLRGRGDGSIKPAFLYPFILKFLKFLTSKLGLGKIAWNASVILIASISAISSLFFIDKSANILFDKKTATIASWIFVLCPYTLFYCLSGGITIYITLGVSSFTYLILKSNIFNYSRDGLKITFTMFFLSINTLFLASLRVTGSFFSIIVILFLGIILYRRSLKKLIKLSKTDKLITYFVFTFCLAYCLYQIKLNNNYISFSIQNFVSEGGTFFGIDRGFIRNQLGLNSFEDANQLKSYFYIALWKIIDFVSGLSDIRDTHTQEFHFISFFPFIARIFVGLFIIYPINIAAFFGTFIYWKRICDSGFWIILCASFSCLLPSLLGVAVTRYLIMVYPPFIIISSKVIGLLKDEFYRQLTLSNFNSNSLRSSKNKNN